MIIYKATIELYLAVDRQAEACDAVAETMRDHLRAWTPESCIVDWRYTPDGKGGWSAPVIASADEIAQLEDAL